MTTCFSVGIIALFFKLVYLLNLLSDLDLTLVSGTYQENSPFLLDFSVRWSAAFLKACP